MASTPGPVFTCRLRPELYPAYRHKYLRQQLTIATLWTVPLPIILWLTSTDSAAYTPVVRVLTVVTLVTPFVALMAYLVYRAMKKARREYEACTFVFTPDTIVRTDSDGRQTVFDLRQVTKTQRVSKKGLMLRTGKPAIFLFIPEQIENYAEVARYLEDGREQAPALARLPIHFRHSLTNAAFAACWIVALFSPIRWLALLAGTFSISFCVFVCWHTYRNPNCTTGAKRAAWLFLGMAALLIWHFS